MRSTLFINALYPLFAVVYLASPATANPAPIGSPGTGLVSFSLKKLRGVSIVDETLEIKDGQKGKIPAFAPGGGTMDVPSVRYQARYHFSNGTGKSLPLKVGFPVIVYSQVAGGSYGGFTALSAYYGGEQLPVKQSTVSKPMIFPRQTLAPIMQELQSARVVTAVIESSDFIDLSKLGRNIKTARRALLDSRTLSEKQVSRVITVLKKVAFGDSDESLTNQSLVWYTFQISLPKGLSKDLLVSYDSFVPLGGDHSFSYILSTGKYWSNRIERLKIVIVPDTDFVNSGGRYELHPQGRFIMQDNRFVLESKNVAPNFDLYVKRIAAKAEN